MSYSNETKLCPFCKEEIKADAIKCKHCSSFLELEKPPHNGICFYCKEEVKIDAIKCKHCGSDLSMQKKGAPCGCSDKGEQSNVSKEVIARRGLPAGMGNLDFPFSLGNPPDGYICWDVTRCKLTMVGHIPYYECVQQKCCWNPQTGHYSCVNV